MSSRGIGGWIWSVSFSLWTLSTVYLCDWVNTSWAVCSDQPGVLQWFHLLIWICILFVPIWSQYTVPHSDPSLVSILFEHIILKLMCFLWNSGHFSSHFRTFLVEFCRDRRLRAFFVNSGLFSSHFRTFIVEFCRDRRLRAFPKILKILASSLFSFPCLGQILNTTPAQNLKLRHCIWQQGSLFLILSYPGLFKNIPHVWFLRLYSFLKNPQHDFPKMRGGGQRPFGTFPKIHPFW